VPNTFEDLYGDPHGEQDDEFEARLASTTEFDALAKWLEGLYRDANCPQQQLIFDKALGLIVTTAQAIRLFKYTGLKCMRGDKALQKALTLAITSQEMIDCFNELGCGESFEQENAVRERMIELAKTHRDLDLIYYEFTVWDDELKRRTLIRKLFDKADELGYPLAKEAGPA
jgi:hypothetical protein